MEAVDTNLLVYAHRRECSEHTVAAGVVRSLAEGARPWAFPWPCLHDFHSVVTTARIWRTRDRDFSLFPELSVRDPLRT